MGGGEPLPGREKYAEDLGGGACLGFEPGREGRPLDEGHGEKDVAPVEPDVMDSDDVRMIQLRERLRLSQKAEPHLVGPFGLAGADSQELDRNEAIELAIIGLVNNAEGALTRALENDVAPHGDALGKGGEKARRIEVGRARDGAKEFVAVRRLGHTGLSGGVERRIALALSRVSGR